MGGCLDSKPTETQNRLDPSAMMVGILREIGDRLLHLEKHFDEEHPEGIFEPVEPIAVTDVVKVIKPLYKKWFSVMVMNDGPDMAYVLVNAEKNYDWHEFHSGEVDTIDMHVGIISDVLLKCNHGETASVRMVGLR